LTNEKARTIYWENIQGADYIKKLGYKGMFICSTLINKSDIEIFDNQSHTAFQELTKGELMPRKAFNFEKALKVSYMIRLHDREETYYPSTYIG
tara:strand:- start:156730 stop:157011 length:282 start_codon:yes stop_codon:yes gene_type:complete